MRKTALHGRLEWKGAAAHMPGAIRKLRREEIPQPTIDRRICFAQSSARTESVDRLPGGIGITLQSRHLCPAAIGALFCQERIGQRLEFS